MMKFAAARCQGLSFIIHHSSFIIPKEGLSKTRRGVDAGSVGFVGFQEGSDVGDAEAPGQFFIHAFAAFAPAFDIEGAEVVALSEGEVAPDGVESTGNEQVAGDGDGTLDDDLEIALGVALANGEDFMLDVFAIEGGVLGEHLKRGGVGGELVISVIKIRLGRRFLKDEG